ncbi:MAG: flippase-like domain-containing protein, partial [Actinomycetota bacterium]|nr:flippase-like domain-containing protein [Actinomycetota bacterium]
PSAAASPPVAELSDDEENGDAAESGGPALLQRPRQLGIVLVAVVLLVVAIYVLFPMVVGLGDSLERIARATWYWIAAGVVFTVASFAAYVALFRGILSGRADEELHRRLTLAASYQITMAGLAATRLFSAAGAGGIALTYWALRRAGMPRRVAACRMVAFLALLYGTYLLALVVFGLLLRTGLLPGEAPLGGTIVPAAVAGVALVVFVLIALIPGDVERRLRSMEGRPRLGRFAARLVSGPATVATGLRTAIDFLRHPRRGALAVGGAVGFWATQIAILWASFEAFGGDVAFGVLVQGFFLGMAANLIPSPAAGAGPVDAGMIGAFLLFGLPGGLVFPAVLTFRVLAFWLPIPPGVIAYFQLRRTVNEWDDREHGYTSQSKVTAEAT